MTLYEFNALSEPEQHEAIWENAVMIGERTDNQHKVILYQLFSFYVELYYHPKLNLLTRLRSFSNVNQLDAYIELLDLKNLKNGLL